MSETQAGPSRIRRTQRAPTTCIPCAKRKSKCSRTVPCTQCIARDSSQECKREVVLVKGFTIRDDDSRLYDRDEIMTVEKLLEENKRLRLEVDAYRRVGLRSLSGATVGASQSDTSSRKDGSTASDVENDLERMATITNLLEMGRERNVRSAQGIQDANTLSARSPFELLKSALVPDPWLPSSVICLDMVRYVVEELGWLYLSSHGPTVMQQCADYGPQAETLGSACYGPAWLAFFLSLLALAVHHASAEARSRWGLMDPIGATKLWFDTSVQALLAADYMSVPDIYNCHTICNLACIFHVYGSSTLGSVLLAGAVRIAQTLRIDQLADEDWCEPTRLSEHACTVHGIIAAHIIADDDLKEREARRRLWWFLLYRDWIAFPAGFRYVVAPELLSLQSPLNIDDSVFGVIGPIVTTPSDQLSEGSFHMARARLSKVMLPFFGTYRQLNRGDPARHRLAWETDNVLEQLLQDTPFARMTASPQCAWHYAASHLFQSLIAHKRLLLFREFFALAFTDDQWQPARIQCVARAEDIVLIRRSYVQPLLGASETTSHYLAAALVLALDFVFYGVNTFNTLQALARKDSIHELVLAIRNTETFEGNAGRMVGQVELLLGLAVNLRNDLSPTVTVPPAERVGDTVQTDQAAGDAGPPDLDDETARWLDELLFNIGSTEDTSNPTGYMGTTDLR